MTVSRRELGMFGEATAKQFLTNKGYVIIGENVRNRFGEIDLIAKDADCLVFVEVRTRRGQNFGTSKESVDLRKQNRLRSVARYYLTTHNATDAVCRFDVIAITVDPSLKTPTIEHIINAF